MISRPSAFSQVEAIERWTISPHSHRFGQNNYVAKIMWLDQANIDHNAPFASSRDYFLQDLVIHSGHETKWKRPLKKFEGPQPPYLTPLQHRIHVLLMDSKRMRNKALEVCREYDIAFQSYVDFMQPFIGGLNGGNAIGQTPLTAATEMRNLPIAKFLIKLGAHVNLSWCQPYPTQWSQRNSTRYSNMDRFQNNLLIAYYTRN